MDTLEGIKILADKSQNQKLPLFGISENVIAQLNDEPAPVSFAAFDISAGLFAAAAFVLMYIGINSWLNYIDPISHFFSPLQEARLW